MTLAPSTSTGDEAAPRPGGATDRTPAESRSPGRVAATFERRGGRTAMVDLLVRAPLKVARPFPRSDGGLDVTVMECSPGLLDGDRYELDWTLGVGAHVVVGTQSHLRVHPAATRPGEQGGPGATLAQRVRVEPGALLEFLPEAVVPFAGARFAGTTGVDLVGDGAAIVAEVFAAGRVARGERFAFARCDSALDVRADGRLVVATRQLLEPGAPGGDVAGPALLGEATHWGAVHVASGALDRDACDALVAALETELGQPAHHAVDASADRLDAHAVTVVALGRSAHELTQTLRACAAVARRALRQ